MRTGIIGFQPQRLTQARKEVGMNKTVLAKKIGRSVSTVSKWESGQQSPEGRVLESLSAVFQLPAHWFTTEIPDDGARPRFFRTRTSATVAAREVAGVRLQWLMETSFKLQRWMKWPELKLPEPTETDLFQITDEQIEALSESCRDLWGLGRGPINDVVQAMEAAGVVCARDTIGHVKMDGVSSWSNLDNRPYVLIVSDKANGIRNRFDAAHELGHLILHRGVDSASYQANYGLIEQQANYFAACFLMPETSFTRDIRRVTLDDLLALKARWKVSVSAMLMRCHGLGLMDDNDKTRLYKNLSARGWRRKEPLDDVIRPDEPKLLGRAVSMIVEHGFFTKEVLLDELGFDASNQERLCGLAPGYFIGTTPFENVELVDFRKQHPKPGSGAKASVVPFNSPHRIKQ